MERLFAFYTRQAPLSAAPQAAATRPPALSKAPVVVLEQQFRMHASVGAWPSAAFYGGRWASLLGGNCCYVVTIVHVPRHGFPR